VRKLKICAAGLALIAMIGVVTYSAESSVDSGKEVYADQKCMMCHSVAGIGNKRFPLDEIGSKMKADELKKFLMNPKETKPNIIMKAYSNLPQEDIDDLVAYLTTLKN